ncbi:MAG: hypothetical protein GSR82_00760 [Desulfurococcales archaeon]|nr:hypothetical protein [Desulfurococcales archaeon]
MDNGRGLILKASSLLLVLAVLLSGLILAVPAHASNPPSYSEVKDAYDRAMNYLGLLTRTTYYPNLYPRDRFVSEYPDIPVWAKYGSVKWIPPFDNVITCSGVWAHPTVSIKLESETMYSYQTVWVFRYTFSYDISMQSGANHYTVAVVDVKEAHLSGGYYTITVNSVSYGNAPSIGGCPGVQGSDIRVYVGGTYVGTVGYLMDHPWTTSRTTPIPSFRFSMRHVQVMYDMLRQAAATEGLGSRDNVLHGTVQSMFNAVFQEDTTPFDLYGTALFQYGPTMQIKPVESIQFYDAHWFHVGYYTYKLGYYRLASWVQSNGYFDASQGTSYPLYAYKSKIVGAAEDAGPRMDGGSLFLMALEQKDDALLHAWRGIYYASQSQWATAFNEWTKVYQYWDGNGIRTTYSDHYSTVRLAAAIMLGVLLAKHGDISWSTVDDMVRALLKTQWTGHGYYLTGGTWKYIYKWDHKGGFIVSYDVAPDGSYGVTGFRPDYLDLITRGLGTPPEYAGVIPTNAETTTAAAIALFMYMTSRY